MKRALKDCDLHGYVCFVHSIKIVVNDGVLSQWMVIDNQAVSRKISEHFNHSTLTYHLPDEIKNLIT